MKARIKFRKYGSLRFIGHLDVMRFFQKVMRRADIPIAFSGGYSPHMIMSFANPLGIGLTSDDRNVNHCRSILSDICEKGSISGGLERTIFRIYGTVGDQDRKADKTKREGR